MRCVQVYRFSPSNSIKSIPIMLKQNYLWDRWEKCLVAFENEENHIMNRYMFCEMDMSLDWIQPHLIKMFVKNFAHPRLVWLKCSNAQCCERTFHIRCVIEHRDICRQCHEPHLSLVVHTFRCEYNAKKRNKVVVNSFNVGLRQRNISLLRRIFQSDCRNPSWYATLL